MDKIKNIIINSGAAGVGIIPYSDCDIINQRLHNSLRFEPRSVFVGIVPYYTRHCEQTKTVSAYALSYDYHTIIAEIGERVIREAQKVYPDAQFAFFCDHSPINEKLAAAKAGLGIIGQNSLLITPEYSSYVFIFELISDLECFEKAISITTCENCGACVKACPGYLSGKSECLSAITQKKGELSEKEIALIRSCGSVWGCDICQEVCPHTKAAKMSGSIYTNSPCFNYNIIYTPTQDTINDSEDFSKRAYSWRGAKVITRNIELLKKDHEN